MYLHGYTHKCVLLYVYTLDNTIKIWMRTLAKATPRLRHVLVYVVGVTRDGVGSASEAGAVCISTYIYTYVYDIRICMYTYTYTCMCISI